MRVSSSRALQIFLASVLLLMSCDVSTFAASEQIPTPIPGAIDLLIAQTAAAAATQTAALLPPTLTPTLTPFPTQTPPDTPTPTPTFIFLLATMTPTSTNGVFTCGLVSQSPLDRSTFTPNQTFTLNWKVKNTGSSAWLQDSVTLDYVSGKQFTGVTVVSLPKTVPAGNSITLSINMTAPSQLGDYTSNWTLVAGGGQTFCNLFLRIIVKGS
ncbi:MAG TPA: NBR1-Ig-like domain-containing protein [Anaerolineales bacterium]|nr:NBR1-Ig-like domain-containing protein [Anaerolineales bacterium]